MNPLVPVIEQSLYVVAIVSGLPLLASTVVSLIAAVLQAATQIQEQSLGFLLKVTTVAVVLILGSSLFLELILEHFRWTFTVIRFLGG